MKKILSKNLINLALNCPYPLYVVGGRVRDFIAGLSADKPDTDICAPADAEDFALRAEKAGFSVNAEYKNTGTLKLTLGGEDYEFTCFRSDEYVRGEHKPVNTFFTTDIVLDAKRRDFKCNAVYYDIAGDKFVDPLGGIWDVKNKVISTVAPAEKVFGEDGLRLMRLARIAAQTGFEPSEECLAGATKNAELIDDISAERIRCELDYILHADKKYGIAGAQYRGLKILHKTGVLPRILPELCLGDKMEQRKDFHNYDVLEHSLRTVLYADQSIRLAALLHDVGKPYCYINSGKFVLHEEEGARIAGEICTRLKYSKKQTEEVVRLTKLHMYDINCNARENKIRKFIVKNYDIFDKLLSLKQADFSACKDDLGVAPAVEKFKRVYGKMQKEGVPFTLKELNIRGNKLIELGIPPANVGKTLNALLFDCVVGEVANDEEKLCIRAVKSYL